MHNPFLSWSRFPTYEDLEPGLADAAVAAVAARVASSLADLEAQPPRDLAALESSLSDVEDELTRLAGLIHHLSAVADHAGWREVASATLPTLTDLEQQLRQHPAVVAALAACDISGADAELLAARDLRLRLGREAGAHLAEPERSRVRSIRRKLMELGSAFSARVLDAQNAWTHLITDPNAVRGLPAGWRAQASAAARSAGHEGATDTTGPWQINLQWSSLAPVLTHSPDRALRERVRRASASIATEGEGSTLPLVREILTLRRELARLLGASTYGELIVSQRMAASCDAVRARLQGLVKATEQAALAELEELREAGRQHGIDEVQQWDVRYLTARIREARVGLDDDEVRRYFPHDHVLQVVFDLIARLFGVRLEPEDEVSVWHPDVRVFRAVDVRGAEPVTVAHLFLDLFARPGQKRDGAWMQDLVARRVDAGAVRLPVAYIVCDFLPGADGSPALLGWRDVETLMHELGHALHHMLTDVSVRSVSGIGGVVFDAIEVPSMFFERWATHRPTLTALTRHVDTGAPAPDAVIDKLLERNHIQGAEAIRHTVMFSTIDLELHDGFDPDTDDPRALEQAVRTQFSTLAPLPTDAWVCSFQHIFHGGYAAGYYSYLWSEVIAADLFAAFQETRDDASRTELGHRFRDEWLARGGVRDPADVFRELRGRDPDLGPLLEGYGLPAKAAWTVIGLRIEPALLPEWFEDLKVVAGRHARRMAVIDKPEEWVVRVEVAHERLPAFKGALSDAWDAFVERRKAAGQWDVSAPG